MPRRQHVEAERERPGSEGGELDPLVAAHARVRGLAPRVGLDEVVDHVLGESVSEVPYVEGDVEDVGDAPGITGVLLRATAPRAGAQRARRGRQREVDTDDVVAGVDHPRRRHRRIDAATHRDQNPHHYFPYPALASAA